MFGRKKKYEEGMKQGAKPFGTKLSKLSEQNGEVIESLSGNMSGLKDDFSNVFDGLSDHEDRITSQETQVSDIEKQMLEKEAEEQRERIYALNSQYDVQELNVSQKQFLIGYLYSLANEYKEISPLQEAYLRNLQHYLGIQEPQAGIHLEQVENIETIAVQKTILQTAVEYMYLYNEDIEIDADEEKVFDCFSVSRRVRQEILDNLLSIVHATGSEGLIEKYGLKEKLAREDQLETEKEELRNQLENANKYSVIEEILDGLPEDDWEYTDEFGNGYFLIIEEEINDTYLTNYLDDDVTHGVALMAGGITIEEFWHVNGEVLQKQAEFFQKFDNSEYEYVDEDEFDAEKVLDEYKNDNYKALGIIFCVDTGIHVITPFFIDGEEHEEHDFIAYNDIDFIADNDIYAKPDSAAKDIRMYLNTNIVGDGIRMFMDLISTVLKAHDSSMIGRERRKLEELAENHAKYVEEQRALTDAKNQELRRYYEELIESQMFSAGDKCRSFESIDRTKLVAAMEAYGNGYVNESDVMLMVDTTLSWNGKEGYLLTPNEIVFKKAHQDARYEAFSDRTEAYVSSTGRLMKTYFLHVGESTMEFLLKDTANATATVINGIVEKMREQDEA
ncbi:hypothetical protein EQG49_05665 [Periweissella cryptocerci]|uniref:Uncharacterized protein n=1 Tax=Periweissella cryptocerci TaxID=2506420 RepID=A0A4P6YTH1_9LACO|nr:hypothetical protein [Periweissella cryptocerci]QBO35982.1 hypothetical protein EQG49_05665 [Periweissella cryptocerci]